MNVVRLDELPLDAIMAHDGVGEIDFVRISDRIAMRGVAEFLDFARVPPGATVGLHEHGDDEELYVVLRGSGVVTVNGVDQPIGPRCILINPPHAIHGIRNEGTEPLEFVVIKIPTREAVSRWRDTSAASTAND